jgi:NAD(P)-dependent dehydrogenase (short-subunit alcohol dehydrogenase family)
MPLKDQDRCARTRGCRRAGQCRGTGQWPQRCSSFVGSEEAKAGLLSRYQLRAATAEEIAETIMFLASNKARYLTGQCVAIDGGYTAQ